MLPSSARRKGHALPVSPRSLLSGLFLLVVLMLLHQTRVSLLTSSPSTAGAAPIQTSESCVAKVERRLADAARRHARAGSPFVRLTEGRILLSKAKALDELSENDRGPLHCVIIGIKDNIEVAREWGLDASAGSVALAGKDFGSRRSTEFSHPGVAKAVEQGALILGHLNMDDFALSWRSYSTIAGQTWNPWDAKRFPGGSSGGCASAVSAELVDAAVCTDTGGSIRIPSSFCGVLGLRPTLGEISTSGVVPLSRSRDTVGPIAKSPEVLRKLYEALRSRVCKPAKRTGWRVGVLEDLFASDEREISSVVRSALETLRGQGKLELVSLTGISKVNRNDLSKHALSTSNYEFSTDLEAYLRERFSRPPSLTQLVQETTRACEERPPVCARLAKELTEKLDPKRKKVLPSSLVAFAKLLGETLDAAMRENQVDLVVFPTSTVLPSELSKSAQSFCVNNRLGATIGFPSMSLPVGLVSRKWPVGMELLGRRGAECELMEAARDWSSALTTLPLPRDAQK